MGFQVENFRSIVDSGFIPFIDDRVSILVGFNGAGKTALLDALLNINSNNPFSDYDALFYERNNELRISFFIDDIDQDNIDLLKDFGVDIDGINGLQITKGIFANVKQLKVQYYYNNKEKKTFLLEFKQEQVKLINTLGFSNEIHIDLNNLSQGINEIKAVINNKNKKMQDRVKEKKIKLIEIEKKIIRANKFLNVLNSLLPRIIEFKQNNWLLADNYSYSQLNSQPISTFLTQMKLPIEQISNNSTSYEKRKEIWKGRDRRFEKELSKYWPGGDIKIKTRFMENSIQIKLKEKNKYFRPESRSGGEKWFLSFFLYMTQLRIGSVQPVLLLIDEHSVNLHPVAQREIIGFMDKILKKKLNLYFIYSTHSPFLVPPKKIERVIRVDKKAPAIGTKTYPFNWEKLAKLRDRPLNILLKTQVFRDINHNIIEGLFSRVVVICEGSSEHKTLPFWAENSNLNFDDRGIVLVDASNKTAEKKLSTIFQIFEIPTFFEFDNDIPEDEEYVVNDKIDNHKRNNRKLTSYIMNGASGIERLNGKYEGYFVFDHDFEAAIEEDHYFSSLSQVLQEKIKNRNDKVLTNIRVAKEYCEKGWETPKQIENLLTAIKNFSEKY